MENYKLVLKEKIEDIKSEGYVFEHKSGAKVIFIDNTDENRVFSVCFKTLPENNTGVPHIMEHSVLCGSEKYRVKDPFNELDKGSINTYLNAITFYDKTLFPVASTNEKDFRNLMEVYLDGVFFPLIYERKGIFLQEGWHKEKDGINGVVYNEMLGAFSQPEEKLDFKIKEELFQNTKYKYYSGGVPEDIPKLSYEEFLDFHRRYYHPANSIIYVYGKNDLKEILNYLDTALSRFEYREIKNEYIKQEKPKNNKPVEISYEEDKSILEVAFIGAFAYEYEKITALNILCDALFNSEAAPIKRKLIDSGLCTDVEGYVDEDLYQSMIIISLQGSEEKNTDRFKMILENALKEIYEKGIDEKLLKGCLLNEKFYIAEGDFGYKPKGLFYNLRLLQGFVYGEESFKNLSFKALFEKAEKCNYMELLKEFFIDNKSFVYGILKNGEAKAENEICLTIENNEKEFLEYQSLEDRKEDIENIPSINLKEIGEEPFIIKGLEENENMVYCKPENEDIVYATLVLDTSKIPFELKKYLGIFRYLIGRLETENYSVEEINNEVNYYFGGFEAYFSSYYLRDNSFMTSLNFSVKALKENSDKIFEILEEVIFKTKFEDIEKIYNKLKEFKNKIEDSFYNSATNTSVLRCLSYFNDLNRYNEEIRGISFYDFLSELLDKGKNEEIINKISELKKYLFRQENLTFSLCCGEDIKKKLQKNYLSFKECFSKDKGSLFLIKAINKSLNEGFVLNGDVNYNIMGADYAKSGFSFNGRLQVINKIIETDYLWNKVRVENGAYGSALSIRRNGVLFFSSYRDPSIKATFEIYKKTSQYLKSLKLRESEIKKYIIGTINVLDKPIKDNSLCELALFRYFSGIGYEQLKRERIEVLSFNNMDILEAEEMFSRIFKADNQCYLCSIGNEKMIKKAEDSFNNVRNIIQRR